LQERHLEWESSRRSERIGEDLTRAGGCLCQKRIFQIGTQAGLEGECKCGAHLHTGCTLIERLAHFFRASVSAGQPEGHAQRTHAGNINLIALTVDGFASLVELQLAARRRIVAASRRAFDYKSVDASVGAAQDGGSEGIGTDNSQEARPVEQWKRAFRVIERIEVHGRVLPLCRAGNRQPVLGRMLCGKRVKDAGNVQRNARAHQHVADAGQHCAVDGDMCGICTFSKKLMPTGFLWPSRAR